VIKRSRLGASKFCDYHEHALATLREMGLSPAQIEALKEFGLLATDNVTGFHEARCGEARISTLSRAIQHVKRTGEQAFYVEMDVQNLSGLNAVLGHTAANGVYAEIAGFIRHELTAVAAVATFFRHGGDEMSAFLIDTTEEAVQAALETVQSRVRSLAKRIHLDAIPHPKHQDDMRWRGVGVHFGFCMLRADHEKDPTLVFRDADTELERRKCGKCETHRLSNFIGLRQPSW
jgi:diguanylate cyclase (GGDEF)-like protein